MTTKPAKLSYDELQQIYASWNPGDGRRLLGHIAWQEAELAQLQKFVDEVGAAIASEGPRTIEHLLATASLGKHTTVIGRCRLNQLHKAEDELSQWQRFASYCRSCAISGETDPLTFDQFIQKEKDAT